MKPVFVDTSGFAALRNRRDTYHPLALAFERQVAGEWLRLLTRNFVLDETYTWLRTTLGHAQAVSFGVGIQQSNIIEIAHITPDIERIAWEILTRYADKAFSYTDCTSFALMRQLDLNVAFSFDEHFRQFGLAVIP